MPRPGRVEVSLRRLDGQDANSRYARETGIDFHVTALARSAVRHCPPHQAALVASKSSWSFVDQWAWQSGLNVEPNSARTRLFVLGTKFAYVRTATRWPLSAQATAPPHNASAVNLSMAFEDVPADLEMAYRRLGGSLELLQDISRIYIEDYGQLLSELERNLRAQSRPAERFAHSLKGLISNFDKTDLVETFALAEQHVRAGAFDDALALIPRLRMGSKGLADELQKFLDDTQAA